MAFRLVKSVGPHFAEVTCTGPYSTADFLAMLDEALDYTACNGQSAVLIDLYGVTGSPGKDERPELGRAIAEVQLAKSDLVTVAVAGRAPMIDPERVGETVAISECAIVKVFEDRGEAIRWLEHTSG